VTEAKRQKVLLAVLGVLALVAVWRYFIAPALGGGALVGGGEPAPPQRRIATAFNEDGGGPAAGPPPMPGAGSSSRVPDDVPTDRALPLNVAALTARPRTFTPGRDPWRFGAIPPPPPTAEEIEARRQAVLLEKQQQEAAEAARKLAEEQALHPPPPPPPQPPPFPPNMKFLGTFGPPQARLAVFSDGKSIYNVKEGGVLQGKFVVARIGVESADITFVGFPDAPPQRLAPGR
jgi:hypothetical protein